MPNLLTFIMCENIAVYLLNIFILLLIVNNSLVVNGENNKYVTCGSVFKLFNTGYKVRLHSHDVKYGTGSGQQSVTGTDVAEDVNSHWVIKAETKNFCNRGEPVKCGSPVRLQHLVTSKNLHSHHFQSPLSGNQEISAYGSDGEGDTGDHWTVLCDDEYWERDAEVKLRHVDTNVYLSVTSSTYGRPINGQHEIVGVDWPNGNHVHWKAMEGLFIHKSNFNAKKHARVHTEL